jgi:hypothetical protein
MNQINKNIRPRGYLSVGYNLKTSLSLPDVSNFLSMVKNVWLKKFLF